MDARLAGRLTGERLNRQLGFAEREVVRVHSLERYFAGFDQTDRRPVGAAGDSERAADRHLLDDDEVAHERRDFLEALYSGEHDAASRRDQVQRFGDGLRGIRRYLDDDV